MRSPLIPSLIALSLLLVSCQGDSPTPPTDDAFSSSSSSAQSVVETHNVSFTGTVRPAGISIYMEGTHRLELGDGRFILLSSETADLNGYVGESVEVTGSIRPTVEEGGTIMRVEQIRLLDSSSASSAAASSVSSESSASSVASVSSVAVPPVSSVASSKLSLPSSSTSSVASVAVDVSAQVAAMAKQNFAASHWTQAYCAPTTISFCVPVHRNWYFKSFGAATEALWHIEVGSVAIENVSDGAIAVDLLGGSLASTGRTDNEVRVEGSMVRGYREWTKDRHIEISAPAALEAAVTYMTQHLSAMEE